MSSTITVRGWVGNKPTLTRTAHDRVFTTVRVASTHRYRDSRNEWVDGDTQWFSAVFWDDAADNVARSVRQGEPVVLTGRLVLERQFRYPLLPSQYERVREMQPKSRKER